MQVANMQRGHRIQNTLLSLSPSLISLLLTPLLERTGVRSSPQGLGEAKGNQTEHGVVDGQASSRVVARVRAAAAAASRAGGAAVRGRRRVVRYAGELSAPNIVHAAALERLAVTRDVARAGEDRRPLNDVELRQLDICVGSLDDNSTVHLLQLGEAGDAVEIGVVEHSKRAANLGENGEADVGGECGCPQRSRSAEMGGCSSEWKLSVCAHGAWEYTCGVFDRAQDEYARLHADIISLGAEIPCREKPQDV